MSKADDKRAERKARNIAENPPRMMEITIQVMGKNCEECGMLFAPNRTDHVFCSCHCAKVLGERRRRAANKGE